jgi:predicted nucleotidyltransferase
MEVQGGSVMREPPVDEIVDKIVEAFHPRRIVLFGSRARGAAGPDSDLDIMVEMDTPLKPLDRRMSVDRLFGFRDWAMDVVVYTPEEVERSKDTVGTLAYTVLREGKTLYEEA